MIIFNISKFLLDNICNEALRNSSAVRSTLWFFCFLFSSSLRAMESFLELSYTHSLTLLCKALRFMFMAKLGIFTNYRSSFFSPPTLKMQYKNGEELLAQKCLTNGPFFAKKMSFA